MVSTLSDLTSLTMKRLLHSSLWGMCLAVFVTSVQAQPTTLPPSALKALGAPNNPKVEIAWNRYYDHAGMTDILQRLAAAYPELTTLESVGQSYEGREMWVLTINNPETGADTDKPAMYIAGNIHANEIQGTEVVLYTAWYLLENYDNVPWIKELVDTKTFYLAPSQSPDSRDVYMNEPNSLRSGQVPVDTDGDGLLDEDCPDDLDNNGHITQMRMRVPGGRWKTDPDDPRIMIQCDPDELCEWTVLFSEGFDNDGDGNINEDCDGGYDPNRNWGYFWRPQYIQFGAHNYPFSLPETRALSNFIKAHPNIIGTQTYHTTGGMILRGPGMAEDRVLPQDDQILSFIADQGVEMLPGYRSLVIHQDLYTTYGGETDWEYATRGILPFANELFTSYNLFRRNSPGGFFGSTRDFYRFDELLLFGEAIAPWTEVEHPRFGTVEVGGVKKQVRRAPPSFLLEEELHRNMAFTLWHAYALPVLSIEEITSESVGNGLRKVTATIQNHRIVPTRIQVDVQNNLTRPDWVTLEGAEVVTSGVQASRFDDTFDVQRARPERVEVQSVPGQGAVIVTWIVRGNGPYTITVDSVKGGTVSKRSE